MWLKSVQRESEKASNQLTVIFKKPTFRMIQSFFLLPKGIRVRFWFTSKLIYYFSLTLAIHLSPAPLSLSLSLSLIPRHQP